MEIKTNINGKPCVVSFIKNKAMFTTDDGIIIGLMEWEIEGIVMSGCCVDMDKTLKNSIVHELLHHVYSSKQFNK